MLSPLPRPSHRVRNCNHCGMNFVRIRQSVHGYWWRNGAQCFALANWIIGSTGVCVCVFEISLVISPHLFAINTWMRVALCVIHCGELDLVVAKRWVASTTIYLPRTSTILLLNKQDQYTINIPPFRRIFGCWLARHAKFWGHAKQCNTLYLHIPGSCKVQKLGYWIHLVCRFSFFFLVFPHFPRFFFFLSFNFLVLFFVCFVLCYRTNHPSPAPNSSSMYRSTSALCFFEMLTDVSQCFFTSNLLRWF